MDILEVFKTFPTQESCIEYLEQVRWKGLPSCPYCYSLHDPPKIWEKVPLRIRSAEFTAH